MHWLFNWGHNEYFEFFVGILAEIFQLTSQHIYVHMHTTRRPTYSLKELQHKASHWFYILLFYVWFLFIKGLFYKVGASQ